MNTEPNLYDVAIMTATQQGFVSADDINPYVPHDRDKRVVGVVLKTLAGRKILEPLGYRKSARSVCHARPIILYRMKRGEYL